VLADLPIERVMRICGRRRNENDSVLRITKPDMSQSLDSAEVLLVLVAIMLVSSGRPRRWVRGWSGGHCVVSLPSLLAQLR
jgi:hypothetical protein